MGSPTADVVTPPAIDDLPLPMADDAIKRAVLDLLREIARVGVAGALAGILVLGLGGRVVMRLAALANPESSGFLTENGNAIGVITAPGTIALSCSAGCSLVWSGPSSGP